ncbi:MAG: hypothetical protein QMB82_05685 [Bacteroidales bacterium]
MDKKYKIAVFYYTQTGQLFEILSSLLSPLEKRGCQLIYKKIVPVEPFVFPWTSEKFYDIFPESRAEVPFPLIPMDFSDILDADLVVLGYQPWFLAPSIPVASFLRVEETRAYLYGRDVIAVGGTRNMWVSAIKSISSKLDIAGARLCGHIALEDRHNNLVSVLTIFRWLINNQKGATRFLPAAGVSEAEIRLISVISDDIYKALEDGDYNILQKSIVEKGGLRFNPNLYFIENNGNKIWGAWARWVLKKGSYGNPARATRLKIFKWYLLTLIFAVSPFGSLFFMLTWPLRRGSYETIKSNVLFLKYNQ